MPTMHSIHGKCAPVKYIFFYFNLESPLNHCTIKPHAICDQKMCIESSYLFINLFEMFIDSEKTLLPQTLKPEIKGFPVK